MRLADYLKQRSMTGTEFAALVGVDDATINRLIPRPGKKQVRRPGWRLVKRITEVTGGEVTANDFVDLPHSDAAA